MLTGFPGYLLFIASIAVIGVILPWGLSLAYTYVFYRILHLQSQISFTKIAKLLLGSMLIMHVIASIFMRVYFFRLPLLFTSQPDMAGVERIQPLIGPGFYGLVIYLPHRLMVYNIVSNVIMIIYLFIGTKYYLGLTGKQLYTFWVIVSLVGLGFTYEQLIWSGVKHKTLDVL